MSSYHEGVECREELAYLKKSGSRKRKSRCRGGPCAPHQDLIPMLLKTYNQAHLLDAPPALKSARAFKLLGDTYPTYSRFPFPQMTGLYLRSGLVLQENKQKEEVPSSPSLLPVLASYFS